ncbi:MAG: LLM class flavin-dependent oxidoreductase [Candidatus Bathyarchaeia archaeon]
MTKVKFGVEVPTFAGGAGSHRDAPLYERVNWAVARETALLAESLGYDSVWMADHFVLGRDEEMFEIWTAMTAIAALTKRVELGTLVMCILHRPPSILGKMAATLDHISNGRLLLGVGAGWNEAEIKSYGLSFPAPAERVARLREGIQVMRAMWTQDKPVYKGKYYSIDGATCRPRPVQPDGPPIIIGAIRPLMLKAVAELGDGWNLADDPTVDTFKEKLTTLNDWCKKVGRNPNTIVKTWDGHIIIANTKKHLEEKMSKLKNLKISGGALIGQLIPGEMLENCIYGTPDECIEKIKRFVALGVSHFSFFFLDYPSYEGIKLFAEQVLPEFN